MTDDLPPSAWQGVALKRISSLLERLGVNRIVLVDDEVYDVTPALVKQAKPHRLGDEQWSRTGDYESFFEDQWSELSLSQKRDAQDRAVKSRPELATAPIDVMRVLFGGAKWLTRDPGSWRENGAQLVNSEDVNRTLVFFDLDLGSDGGPRGGADLMRHFLEAHPDGRALLLTSTIKAENELDVPAEIADAVGRPARDLLVASKDHLEQARATEFADLVRTSLSTPNIKTIRDGVRSALDEAHAEALDSFDELQLRVIEDIVVRASRSEGVWEIDTYLRVFAIMLRESLHRRVANQNNKALRLAIDEAREVARIPHGDHIPSRRVVNRLMAAEHYASAKVINDARLPLENGDFFAVGAGLYVLVMQPCDLMFRDDGTGVREQTEFCRLLEVERTTRKPTERQEPMPPGLVSALSDSAKIGGSGEFVADLKSPRHIGLELLDLCTINSSGQARLDLDSNPPPALLPRQTERYAELRQKVMRSSQSHIRAKRKGTMFLEIGGDVEIKRRWSPGYREVQFDLRRVARLSAPHSAQLLTAFAHDVSRAAYDAPLDRF